MSGRFSAIGILLSATLVMPVTAACAATAPADVVKTYMDIGAAVYGDAAAGAQALDKAVDALLAKPSQQSLDAARTAWKAARIPYLQSEGFRFGNKIVDDWEGGVNSWPLDEGLIDYVDKVSYGEKKDENPLYTANIIAHPSLRIGATVLNAKKIDKSILKQLDGAMDVEANVGTGYHAIEFLLWGQDLNGTGPGAGNRPATDYDLKACTGGNCDRRRDYLKAATSLLVDDLVTMANNWKPGGAARAALDAQP
jgi:putative iron-regulated protein